MIKRCSKCLIEKELNKFSLCKPSKDGYRSTCQVCRNNKRKETDQNKRDGYLPKYGKINIILPDDLSPIEKTKLYQKEYRKIYGKDLNLKKREDATNAKIEGIAFYGGKCSCCGENIFEFLTLEHLNGRLEEKGKRRRTGKDAWLKAKRAGYPDSLTVLCFNCNCAKGIYGSCPHTWKDRI